MPWHMPKSRFGPQLEPTRQQTHKPCTAQSSDLKQLRIGYSITNDVCSLPKQLKRLAGPGQFYHSNSFNTLVQVLYGAGEWAGGHGGRRAGGRAAGDGQVGSDTQACMTQNWGQTSSQNNIQTKSPKECNTWIFVLCTD
jgi:hypothetical protein